MLDNNIARTTPNLPRVQVGPDPNHWVNENAQKERDLSDRVGLTLNIEAAFAEGKTAQQATTALADKLAFLPEQERTAFVRSVRATLNIPSRATEEGEAEFLAWKQDRDRKLDPSAPSVNGIQIQPKPGLEVDPSATQLASPGPTAAGHVSAPETAAAAQQDTLVAATNPPEPSSTPVRVSNRQHIEELRAERNNATDPAERALIQQELDAAIENEPDFKDALQQTVSLGARDAGLEATPGPANQISPTAQQDSRRRAQLELAAFVPEPAATQSNDRTTPAAAKPGPATEAQQAAAPSPSPKSVSPNTSGAAPTPPHTDQLPEPHDLQPPEQANNPPRQEKDGPQHVVFSGAGGALVNILAAMKKPNPQAPAQPNQRQANLADRLPTYEEQRGQPRRDLANLAAAVKSGETAVAKVNALKALTKQDTQATAVLGKIELAIQNNPKGRQDTFEQLRAGGQYADLRAEFNEVLANNNDFSDSYKETLQALENYAGTANKAAEIPQSQFHTNEHFDHRKKLAALHEEIEKEAAHLPTEEDGKSALDGLNQKFREGLDKVFNTIGKVFRRDHDADASARPSAGPSPT